VEETTKFWRGAGTTQRRWNIVALLAVGEMVNYFDRINISVAGSPLTRARPAISLP
jgi:hypothetical protein